MPDVITGDIAAHSLIQAVEDANELAANYWGRLELTNEGDSILEAYRRLGNLIEFLGLRQAA